MKRVQFPQDFFCTQTWPPIHCFVHKYGCRDVMWKRSIVSTVREKGWRIGGECSGEHSPPTSVARVLIMASTPHVFPVGWVCCWFSPLLERFFSGYSGFRLSLIKPTLPNSNSIRNARTQLNEVLWTPKYSVVKQITNFNFYNYGNNKTF